MFRHFFVQPLHDGDEGGLYLLDISGSGNDLSESDTKML
jgi:hypothetical protein